MRCRNIWNNLKNEKKKKKTETGHLVLSHALTLFNERNIKTAIQFKNKKKQKTERKKEVNQMYVYLFHISLTSIIIDFDIRRQFVYHQNIH